MQSRIIRASLADEKHKNSVHCFYRLQVSYTGTDQELTIPAVMGRIWKSICRRLLGIRGGLLSIWIGSLGGIRIRIIREVRANGSIYQVSYRVTTTPSDSQGSL